MSKNITIVNKAKNVITTRDENLNRFFRELNHIQQVEENQIMALLEAAQNGNRKAANRLIESNLKIVVSAANAYKFMSTMDLSDLINEGVFGLHKAVYDYNDDKNTSFLTFAGMLVLQAIFKAINRYGTTIHVPANLWKELQFQYTSGDAPAHTDDEGNTVSVWECTASESIDPTAEMDAKATISHLLSGVRRNKDREIICKIFGIGCDHEHTLVELAAEYECTEEAVRQIKVRALEELKKLADRSKRL